MDRHTNPTETNYRFFSERFVCFFCSQVIERYGKIWMRLNKKVDKIWG